MVSEDIKKRFLRDTDETGRFIVKSLKTGRTYYVEPIDNSGHPSGWGDLDPVTKKFSSEYGCKYTGSITEKESLITKENGFVNIKMLGEGVSPLSYIDEIDRKYEAENIE